MAMTCSLLSKFRLICSPSSRALSRRTFSVRPSLIPQIRPLISSSEGLRLVIDCRSSKDRCFSTRSTTSSIQDPSPNWSNRPPKETILLDGCDFEHWLVVVEKPDEKLTRDEIIDSYIKTLAQVVGSDEEARMKIYSVSTKHYFAFGALVSEELSYKIKALPGVRWVLPDSYLDVKNKDYGGEPFIDGQAVPYDPKYHEEWVRNNQRATERSRRQDRPRNYDRSRNFERRRENMQSREYQPREAPPMPNFQTTTPPGPDAPPPNTPNQIPFPNQGPPNPQPNYGYQARPPPPPPPGGNQGYQPGPPPGYQPGPPSGGQGYQASPPGGGQGYQAGPPGGGSQGYQTGPPGGGSQGYQTGPPGGGSQGYQPGPPGGGSQGYQPGPPGGGQGYQPGLPGGGQGYQPGPRGGPGYQPGPPGGQGYQSGPPGGNNSGGSGQTYLGGNQSVGQGYPAGPPRPIYPTGQPSSSAPYYGGPPGGGAPSSSQGNFGATNYVNGGGSDQSTVGNRGGYGSQGGQPGPSGYQGGNNQPTDTTSRDIPGRDA